MIDLAHHPTIQAAIDRWRLELPIVPQIDESAMTKEHLRALIHILIHTLEEELQRNNSNNSNNLSDEQLWQTYDTWNNQN